MNQMNYRELEARYYMPAFSREIMIERGLGSKVWDAEGNEYIDCVAGIAVCSTGHCHPLVTEAICEQARRLIHCSNLYYVPGQAELARDLVGICGMHKAFFANSGAEANDGAIKLARLATRRMRFVAFTHGFHGRTLGSLSVTHKPAIREPFQPLEPACTFVEYGDSAGLEKVMDESVAAVFIEPIQGEAGVIIPPVEFIRSIREQCDATGALMIADEVQTGMGRTGKWLAIQHTGVKPDIVTLAKGIASGFPMGALLARQGLEFKMSEHGSTFAGGPLACAAARATIDVIGRLLPDVERKGRRFADLLAPFKPRQKGLMIGISVGDSCPSVQKRCAENGVLVNCAAEGNLRIVPPLVITDEEIDRAAHIVGNALSEIE
ncbi:MAG TPA: acetylornithine/succinylornithine family transaminase [Methanoregulaceae archaeon]|nr:MAG: acetylornithine/succinylornithine family transaminase [Methanolinea sp.]HON81133.1 acetylornithine/succinylornithine family transaminase [Methanoregulaceae archaeon]HPD09923.1 acetylornithine/succinylornithine family transaminase [Methanoregulaceae archaeon]HRT14886.1 acetylornithine/succinylornithine family transaminase [Methanoregulaceae archaeon]HRU30499.1 acetylornithine/succinylornithine family transaminase [Methanoregulaceae archaeon]